MSSCSNVACFCATSASASVSACWFLALVAWAAAKRLLFLAATRIIRIAKGANLIFSPFFGDTAAVMSRLLSIHFQDTMVSPGDSFLGSASGLWNQITIAWPSDRSNCMATFAIPFRLNGFDKVTLVTDKSSILALLIAANNRSAIICKRLLVSIKASKPSSPVMFNSDNASAMSNCVTSSLKASFFLRSISKRVSSPPCDSSLKPSHITSSLVTWDCAANSCFWVMMGRKCWFWLWWLKCLFNVSALKPSERNSSVDSPSKPNTGFSGSFATKIP